MQKIREVEGLERVEFKTSLVQFIIILNMVILVILHTIRQKKWLTAGRDANGNLIIRLFGGSNPKITGFGTQMQFCLIIGTKNWF